MTLRIISVLSIVIMISENIVIFHVDKTRITSKMRKSLIMSNSLKHIIKDNLNASLQNVRLSKKRLNDLRHSNNKTDEQNVNSVAMKTSSGDVVLLLTVSK